MVANAKYRNAPESAGAIASRWEGAAKVAFSDGIATRFARRLGAIQQTQAAKKQAPFTARSAFASAGLMLNAGQRFVRLLDYVFHRRHHRRLRSQAVSPSCLCGGAILSGGQ